ncbi:hypothetical protein KIW84_023249 [Lathyrus oleraceus]|uniref:S-protein homolog n=1 Tax=Pisum sativum TaxID=3888 RepID=A0A9D4YGY9_PEA|nr:hypothetical protein KIW84_023249 [Pisum sativum]
MSPMLMRIVVPISLVLLLVVVSEAGILSNLVHIEVTNGLSNNKNLDLHCFERYGEEPGEVTLPPGGQFKFSFRRRIIGRSTKFYCSVKWIGSNLLWFDLWSQGRDGNAGRLLRWTVREKEVCRFDAARSYSVCAAYRQKSIFVP